ncbi:MAG TPA: heme peroxidase family protein [Candidatus Acidoferrales bacterium]
MPQHHSTPLRGLISTGRSPLFQGRFGRMFRSLPKAVFGRDDDENIKNLTKLGFQIPVTKSGMSALFDPPTDGPDPEEGGIPALYTYLGQFMDHDITFDPASSLQAQDDPDALTDFRTPAFDLDNIYGRGPDDQPYMYNKDGMTFLLGDPLTGDRPPNPSAPQFTATDLPRNSAHPARALIGDPRNDENTIVSQLQGLFHRFHNRTVQDHPDFTFAQIQERVRFHYQYMILHDFLPRIINANVLKELRNKAGNYDQKNLKFFHWKNEPFMPVEFSVAAYRLGHSMVRPGYRLNSDAHNLLPIFSTPESLEAGFPHDLAGFQKMASDRAIDWGRFIDIDDRPYGSDEKLHDKEKEKKRLHENAHRLQFAYRLDTSVVFALSNLPIPSVVAAPPPALPVRNLIRGWRLGLPTGQHVARAMGHTPLEDKDIRIGKGVDKQDPKDPPIIPINRVDPVFAQNCPLWTYILAEAMHHQIKVKIPVEREISITTPQLGPVGGRIVAEVFLGLMFGDNHSLLSSNPTWTPDNKNFALKDFVNYALGK